MSRRWQDVVHDIEPLTISAAVVAQELEGLGRPRMASYIRGIGDALQRTHDEVDRWQKLYHETAERLEVYEPRPPVELPRHYKPPPESSD
jgi:hypothetical protein